MKRSRLSEEQITFAMRQHDAGTPAEDICRQPSSCHSTMQSANWTFAQRTHRSYGLCRHLMPTESVANHLKVSASKMPVFQV
jgi:hypothetical protein